MRCPKCGNEVDFKAMECARCGLATPKGQKPSTSSKKGTTGKLTTGRLKKPVATSFLPKFLADSPLAKIDVSAKMVIPLVLLFPLAAAIIYYLSSTPICLNCAQVGGQYVMEFPADDKKLKLELKLLQYEAAVSGQVVLIPTAETAVTPTGGASPAPTAPQKKYVELIQAGSVTNNQVNFQTYPREGNMPRIQFSGQLEGTLLKGNMKLTMPDLNISNKSIPISVQKQAK